MSGTTGLRYHQKRPTRAYGCADSNGRRIAITFPTLEFDRIRDLALRNNISFQEQVRRLCRAEPGED